MYHLIWHSLPLRNSNRASSYIFPTAQRSASVDSRLALVVALWPLMTSNDKPRTGLSLYANLLNKDGSSANAGATISSAPVTYKKPSDAQAEVDAAKRNGRHIEVPPPS